MRGSRDAVAVPRASLVEEMASGALGDQRLDARRDRLMTVLEQHPDTAFPEACADDAEVDALYRFLRNRRVSLRALFEPHVIATHARCTAVGEVLVIHDPTDMVFAGRSPARRAGGVGEKSPGTRKDERARFEDPDKESRHWRDGIAAVRTRCGDALETIHLMDRGADSYELLAAMIADRFVVRLTHDRCVATDDGLAMLHEATARTRSCVSSR